MGNNVDLCHMLGAPTKTECPRCRREMSTQFDDYDIECGHPNPEPSVWSLRLYCDDCDHDWTLDFKVALGFPDAAQSETHRVDAEGNHCFRDPDIGLARAVAEVERLREVLAALKAEHKDAMEVLATVAQVNSYYPGETFPRAITTANRFMATVDEVGKLKARADGQKGAVER